MKSLTAASVRLIGSPMSTVVLSLWSATQGLPGGHETGRGVGVDVDGGMGALVGGMGVIVGVGVTVGVGVIVGGTEAGPQDGHPSGAELLVRRATPVPSAFIAYISRFPSLRE